MLVKRRVPMFVDPGVFCPRTRVRKDAQSKQMNKVKSSTRSLNEGATLAVAGCGERTSVTSALKFTETRVGTPSFLGYDNLL